jgi:hypothetical protein
MEETKINESSNKIKFLIKFIIEIFIGFVCCYYKVLGEYTFIYVILIQSIILNLVLYKFATIKYVILTTYQTELLEDNKIIVLNPNKTTINNGV